MAYRFGEGGFSHDKMSFLALDANSWQVGLFLNIKALKPKSLRRALDRSVTAGKISKLTVFLVWNRGHKYFDFFLKVLQVFKRLFTL